jgi:teichuronic acid biosynthesis glycosyltransferase TuaH
MRILMSEALPFDGPIRVGSHHIARGFMEDGHSVFWLGGTYHPLSLLTGHRAARRAFAGPTPIGPRSWSHHPVTGLPFRAMPPFDSRVVLERSLDFALPDVGQVLALYGFDEPDVLWLSQCANSLALLRRIRARRVLYRMSDHYAAFRGVPSSLSRAETEILDRADVVLVTARTLLEGLPESVRAKAHYLPNAADGDHFARRDLPEPADLAAIPRPRALFVGSIREWVDLDLLASVARARPETQLILIGPEAATLDVFSGFDNVHLLGPRDYDTLPAYLRHVDVGLIPFAKNELTDATCPVKLFEYFAAGLPVVATRLAELERLGAPVLLANDTAEFVGQLDRAMHTAPRDVASFVAENTWRARTNALRSLLN